MTNENFLQFIYEQLEITDPAICEHARKLIVAAEETKQLALCYRAALECDYVPKKVKGVSKDILEAMEGLRPDEIANELIRAIFNP